MIQDDCELFTSFIPSASRLDTLMLDTMSRKVMIHTEMTPCQEKK